MIEIELTEMDAVQLARLNQDSSALDNSVFQIAEMDRFKHFSTSNAMMVVK